MSEIPEEPRAADVPATYWLRPKTNRVLVAAIGLAILACLAWIVQGTKPWDAGLDFSREAKERIRTHSFAVKGLWIGALINLGLGVGILVIWRLRPKAMCDLRRKHRARSRPDRLSLREKIILSSLVGAAIATAATMMWPRLSLSLWGDEEATARRFIVGNVHRREDSLVLISPSWEKTLWNWDTGPNSHMFLNLLARLSHGPGDISGDAPDRFYFSERRIRLPSFLATLAMIASAAWLTALLGAPRGSPLAAFFLALHPWIVRYGTEARGYALMMAFAVLAFCFLLKALRSEKPMRWWIGFGLCEFLLLYSHLISVYLLVPLNAAALWAAWSPWKPGHRNPFRVADIWRLAGANLLGAALSIQLMLPNALQFPEWLKGNRLHGPPVGSSWIENWLAYWSAGMPWHDWEPRNPHNLTLEASLEAHPAITGGLLGLLSLLLLAGVLGLLSRKGMRIWLLPILLPVPLMFLVAWQSETLLYAWYAVGFMPLAAVALGIGAAFLTGPLRRLPKAAAISGSVFLAATTLVLFGYVSQLQRQLFRTVSVEPLAETVRMTRSVVNPFHPEIDEVVTLGFVHATQLYDPAMIYARNDEQFVAAVQRAEDNGKTLWVNAANLHLGRPVFPGAFELLDNRDVFEEPEVIHGLQVPCTRYLFRYKPGGLAKANP